jgi:hypothetical protein
MYQRDNARIFRCANQRSIGELLISQKWAPARATVPLEQLTTATGQVHTHEGFLLDQGTWRMAAKGDCLEEEDSSPGSKRLYSI